MDTVIIVVFWFWFVASGLILGWAYGYCRAMEEYEGDGYMYAWYDGFNDGWDSACSMMEETVDGKYIAELKARQDQSSDRAGHDGVSSGE